ncbi:hypothetical protein HJFPF1_08744 [Paramyrothecium foliicola]|nr:hypothetical protein HJFPF1_08744 [Paramyrothecium foliicola]
MQLRNLLSLVTLALSASQVNAQTAAADIITELKDLTKLAGSTADTTIKLSILNPKNVVTSLPIIIKNLGELVDGFNDQVFYFLNTDVDGEVPQKQQTSLCTALRDLTNTHTRLLQYLVLKSVFFRDAPSIGAINGALSKLLGQINTVGDEIFVLAPACEASAQGELQTLQNWIGEGLSRFQLPNE